GQPTSDQNFSRSNECVIRLTCWRREDRDRRTQTNTRRAAIARAGPAIIHMRKPVTGYWTLEIGGSGPAAADWLPEAGAARREDGGLIIVGGFESGDAFADTISACSGLGEGTADAAGAPATTAAPALVSEEISLSPSAAAGI